MKKRFVMTIIFAVIATVFGSISLTACAKQEDHTHTYGAWMSDGAQTHTRECACGDSQTKAHTYSGSVCSRCGYINTSNIPESPAPDGDKKDYDMNGVIFADATYSYDGKEHVLEITGALPDGVTVSYTPNALYKEGELVVTATFSGDTENYNPIEPMTATLKVVKDGKYHDVLFMTTDDAGVLRVVKHGEAVANIPTVPTKDGYNGTWNVALTQITNDTVVTPQYTPIRYSITYECGIGQNEPSNPFYYTVETPTIALNAATAANATFDGWYTSQNFDEATKVQTIPTGSKGNITLYAKFIANNTRTVTYLHAGIKVRKDEIEPDVQYTIYDYSPSSGYTTARWIDENGNTYLPDDTLDFSEQNDITLKCELVYDGTDFEYTVTNSEATITGYNNNDIVSLIIPDYIMSGGNRYSVTTIGNGAFEDCKDIASMIIPVSVTLINGSPFNIPVEREKVYYYAGDIAEWCSMEGLKGLWGSIEFDKTFLYINGARIKGELVIPDGVTSVCDYAFYGCMGLTSVTIPDSVTNIGEYAFGLCLRLTSVTLGNNVENLDNYAFALCLNLISITIPRSVKYIAENTFYSCEKLIEVYNLSNIIIAVGSEEIGNLGYYAKNVYTAVSGSSKLHNADGYIFYEDGDEIYLMGYRGADTELVLPQNYNGKKYLIYEFAFAFSYITRATIPDVVTSIGRYVFYFCAGLVNVTLGNGIEHIGTNMFYGCINLTNISISDSISDIAQDAFRGCDNLHYNVYNNAKYLGNKNNPYLVLMEITNKSVTSCTIHNETKLIFHLALSYCTQLTDITIPDNIANMGYAVFAGCTSLASATIGNGLEQIAAWTFYGCTSLTSVTIRDGVTSIENYAFSRDCIERLTSVYYKGTPENYWNETWYIFFNNATKYYYSEVNPYLTNPDDTYKYWYYNGNEIAVWTK